MLQIKKNMQYLLLGFGLLVHLSSIPLLSLNPLADDATQFNNEADNIKSGVGWINTEGPGMATVTYPSQVGFLLVCKYVFGDSNTIAPVILQHIFVLITALIIYNIALMLTNSKRIGLLAELIVMLFPHMIHSANVLNSHVSGMLFSVIGIFLLMRKNTGTWWYLGIGAVWAVATMARFTYQFFVPMYVILSMVLFIRQKNKKDFSHLIKSLLFVVGFVLVLLPWWNHVQKAQAGPYGYSGAWRICYAFNRAPEDRNNSRDENELEWASIGLSIQELDSLYRSKTIENIKQHPKWFINNVLTNTSFMMINLSTEEQPHMAIYSGILYSILMGFGVVGFLSLNKKQLKLYIIPSMFLIVVFAVHIPIYGYISNAFPVWALFIPVSATGIIVSLDGAIKKRSNQELNRYPQGRS